MSNLRIEFIDNDDGPDLVEVRRVGDMNTVIYKVSEKLGFLEEHFPLELAAYQKTGATEIRAKGTPLTDIKGLGKRRASTLEKQDVKTVEQLAELSDASINSLGAGMVDLRKKARDHIADAAGIEPVRTVG
jgi:nucleotidyltransferase/DNA polymerase involved in DNA repair